VAPRVLSAGSDTASEAVSKIEQVGDEVAVENAVVDNDADEPWSGCG